MTERRKTHAMKCFPIIVLALTAGGCVTLAPPAPLVTFGGPETVVRGHSEVALAVGSGGILYPQAHATGHAWFGRWRYGVTDRLDCGVDVLGVQHSDNGTLTAKAALRYGLLPHLRVEVGAGAADDSLGKSLNGEVGVTTGTRRPDATWNYYTSFRIGAARGFRGDACCNSGATGDVAPPNSLIAVGGVGAAGRVTNGVRFVIEGGHGFTWVEGRHDVGRLLYVGMGLLMDIGDTDGVKRLLTRQRRPHPQ